jgi:hypothetical protein
MAVFRLGEAVSRVLLSNGSSWQGDSRSARKYFLEGKNRRQAICTIPQDALFEMNPPGDLAYEYRSLRDNFC